MLGLGIWLWRTSGGASGPAITLSALSIAENAVIGDLVGTLSVIRGSGSYTFSITADPDSKFILDLVDNTRLELSATVDFETKTSHTVTIQATNGVDPAISRTFTITVTNVFEQPSLVALSLSASTITEGSAENTSVGSVVGKTTGSTLSLINDASGRFKLSGSNILAGATATNYATATTHDITIRETLADSANSPRDTVITITVTQAGVGPTNGIQLENGSFLLAENGDYLVREAA